MVVAVRAQPKAPMLSPPTCMISCRQAGSFWLKTGTPQGEPVAAALGLAVGWGLLAGCRPRRPVALSMPGKTPTLSLAVQHKAAVWPRAKTLAGRSASFCGDCEPSGRADQIWKPAAWLAAGARPTT